MKYYYMMPESSNRAASAYPINGIKLAHELIDDLEHKTQLPTDFELFKVIETKEGLTKDKVFLGLDTLWLDFLPNSLAWPFYSKALRDIIDRHVSDLEGLDWIICNVIGGVEKRTYYIPRFNIKIDSLDRKLSQYIPGTDYIRIPVVSLEKIKKLAVFHSPRNLSNNLWKIQSTVYMSQVVVEDIKRAKLTGLEFVEIYSK
jgi:hypothetical protein